MFRVVVLLVALFFLCNSDAFSLSSNRIRNIGVVGNPIITKYEENRSSKLVFGISTSLRSTNDNDAPEGTNGIDTSEDSRLTRVRLSRATGIEWGTDLSFSFVYVRDMDPTGEAALSNEIEKGDQLCELRPVVDEDGEQAEAINLIGASFDNVMNAFATLSNKITDVDLVFFRGTKDDLIAACNDGDGDGQGGKKDTICITVIQNKGSPEEETRVIEAPVGCNVRQTLVDEGINVYQSFTRWTNCKGKQLCGTCIVNITDGAPNTNRKSMDELSTLRENPDSYRLSCVSFAYGDVTVETFPPINAAQWTR